MKNRILAALAAVFALLPYPLSGIAFAAPQPAAGMSGSRQVSYNYIEDASNATVELVAAAAGKTISLYKYTVSAATSDTIYFKCGTRQVAAKKYLAATSGVDPVIWPFYIQCQVGESLSLVKGSGATAIGIDYWYTQQQ